ncbi:MAG: TonB-dependent receptor [Caldimicrobium sp.]|nr:TonB-dependent receptor [Caldimicrobium sp.]MCX7873900.1 TonB-dependent receptor [Caldimicrobium sp.]MDW8093482.1 TonB-dependent receptor [Caldimicrobium sp.]
MSDKLKAVILSKLGVLTFCALAEAKVTIIPEVEVVGEAIVKEKSEVSIRSEALPASVQVITKEEIEKMPIRHYTDIFRKVPGMKTIYMGQGEVGDRLGTRGFWNGYAVFVDGMPLNMAHHNHLHGLADAAWLVPEMIERIEIIKGPFSALYGNFALGGVINIITKKYDKTSAVRSEVGSFGALQSVVTLTTKRSDVSPFLVYEVYKKDGYRDNSDLERYNFFNKLTFPFWKGELSIRVNYVKRDWGAPGYLPVEDLKKGLIGRKVAVNRSDDGNSEYLHGVINYAPKGEAGFHGTLYLAYEDFNRVATFPPSPQRWEHNRRTFYGWNLLYNYLPSKNLSFVIGTDGRYDDGIARRHNTIHREITSTIENWDIEELTYGLFTQLQWKPIELLKFSAGMRYDGFVFDVKNKILHQNSGSGNTEIFSPKIGIVFSPLKGFNLYANRGAGFRSPYVKEISPADRIYKNFNLKPAKLETWDVGINAFLFGKVALDFNYYETEMEREIVRIGTEVQNIGRSERKGYEGEIKFYFTENFIVFANYAFVDAKIVHPPQNKGKVVNIPKTYFNTGLEWTKELNKNKRLTVDVYTQVYGKTPLNLAGSINRGSFAKYYGKIQYVTPKITLYGGVIYHPDKYKSEGYFLVNDIVVIDPRPKWDLNFGFKYSF